MKHMEYAELNALPAEAFLNPDTFRTPSDADNQARDGYGDKQYQKGLQTSRECKRVFISANGTWCADTLTGGFITSYEGIGYHANTADLLRGFLDGPAGIFVYRQDGFHKLIKQADANRGK